MSVARQQMRLGNFSSARATLSLVEQNGKDSPSIQFFRSKMARLSGHHTENIEGLKNSSDSAWELEIAWEQLVATASKTNNHQPLAKQISKGGQFYSTSYILEGQLWIYASSSQKLIEQLENPTKFRRRQGLDATQYQTFTKIVSAIHEFYDASAELDLRLAKLHEANSLRNSLLTIEQELLFLAAAVRATLRFGCHSVMQLLLDEYRALSYRLSDGGTNDALNILQDMEANERCAS